MNLLSKLPNVGTTIFTTMSQMALDHNAINLGQGFPDFNPDSKLLDLVNKAMREGHNQYPAMAGVPALREAIQKKVASLYGHTYRVDTEITVTSGATEALSASLLALVHPGDEVIIIEPFYDLYLPVIELAGGKPVIVSMMAPDSNNPRFRVDWQAVNDAITSKTKLLIVNFPHNPTGIVMTAADLDSLEEIVNKTGILVLGDEVYEHLVFDGAKHLSLATRPSLAANSVVIFSFGKTYNVTGWKIGYVCAPEKITAEIRKVHQFLVFTVPSPLQVGLATFMQDESTYSGLSDFYEQKRDLLSKGLNTTALKPLPSEGTFFLLAEYSQMSDLPQLKFSTWLTKEKGVTVIPVSAFYQNPQSFDSTHRIVRFCFAKQDATLLQAVERLKKV